jgi:hypothetical protein
VNPGTLRVRLRAAHLACSGVLGFLVYAPDHVTDGTFELVVAVVFFPLLALTGLGMWFGPRILRARGQRAGAARS